MMIFYLLCVFVTCVLEAGCFVPFSSVNCTKTPNCPLFNLGSNIVTMEHLQQEVEDGVWALIYYTEFDSKQTYGKCNFRWNAPDENNMVRRQPMCFNLDRQECEDFERKVTRKLDDCDTAEENAVNAIMDAKFYSQDIFQYFWYDSCYEYNDANECTVRYLDLMVRKSRILIEPPTFQTVWSYSDRSPIRRMYRYHIRTPPKQVLDLHGLPWDLISADLKNIFDLDIGNNLVKFSWMGQECGFDGKVIQGPNTFY